MADENRKFSDKIALRLPGGMRDRIAAVAERNNRSTNAEIVARLERSLDLENEAAGAPRSSIEGEIETLRDQIRVEAMERKRLEERLVLVEKAGSPDLYHIEMRLLRLERSS